MCIENLRWVYNDMLNEPEPVEFTSRLYRALKSCITIADPASPQLADKRADDFDYMRYYAKRRLAIREYVLMLRDVEARRIQAVEHIARKRLDLGIASMAEQLPVDETETKV
jgi:hypothetical protein